MRTWCAELGLDVSVLPGQPTPVRPNAWEQKREAEQRAEEAQHAQRAEEVRAQAAREVAGAGGSPGSAKAADTAAAAPLPPTALAEAWAAEHQAKWRSEPAPLTELPSGPDVAALDAEGREAVLCALLQRLVSREERQAGLRDPINPPVDGFDLDESVNQPSRWPRTSA